MQCADIRAAWTDFGLVHVRCRCWDSSSHAFQWKPLARTSCSQRQRNRRFPCSLTVRCTAPNPPQNHRSAQPLYIERIKKIPSPAINERHSRAARVVLARAAWVPEPRGRWASFPAHPSQNPEQCEIRTTSRITTKTATTTCSEKRHLHTAVSCEVQKHARTCYRTS